MNCKYETLLSGDQGTFQDLQGLDKIVIHKLMWGLISTSCWFLGNCFIVLQVRYFNTQSHKRKGPFFVSLPSVFSTF